MARTRVDESGSSGVPKRLGRPPKGWKAKFLEAFAVTGIVKLAAAKALVSTETAYQHRARDAAFAAGWESALRDAADLLEAEAFRRGVRGWDEPVYQGGQQVGVVRRYSDPLLIKLLGAAKPEKYRERHQVEARVEGSLAFAQVEILNTIYGDPTPDTPAPESDA